MNQLIQFFKNDLGTVVTTIASVIPIVGLIFYAINTVIKDSFERYYNSQSIRMIEKSCRFIIFSIIFTAACFEYEYLINSLITKLPKSINSYIMIVCLFTFGFFLILISLYMTLCLIIQVLPKRKTKWLKKFKNHKSLLNTLVICFIICFLTFIVITGNISHVFFGIKKISSNAIFIFIIAIILVHLIIFSICYWWLNNRTQKHYYTAYFNNSNLEDLNGLIFKYLLKDGSLVLTKENTTNVNEVFVLDKSNNQYIKFVRKSNSTNS